MNILEFGDRTELVRFIGNLPPDYLLREDEFRHILERFDAFWIHPGGTAPHAVTREGKCTDGFIDVMAVVKETGICTLLARQLTRIIGNATTWGNDSISFPSQTDWVIGSAYASIDLSHEVARLLGCRHAFTEKGEGNAQEWRRYKIADGERVFRLEELITSTGTVGRVTDGIVQGNGAPVEFAPFIVTLVHRSKEFKYGSAPILYAYHYDISVWDESACPLCAAGSKRIESPKKHWAELTAH